MPTAKRNFFYLTQTSSRWAYILQQIISVGIYEEKFEGKKKSQRLFFFPLWFPSLFLS